ncbi:UBN2 domain-containing protein [Gossypium australe]|uniref:UBN2 domain-containing protein n=1 Tax=Gossypium australe TaxID=47621 RepID=A0A5B6WEW4_9ROSI|nr:UBN2 domain-containing protein [Gossypium australe]
MFDRFTHIINGLKAIGKIYPNKEMVKKMLNSLPTSWEAKMMAIEESKDLNSLSFDELIGSLLIYEMRLNKGSEKERIMKKNVGKVLKSTTNNDKCY